MRRRADQLNRGGDRTSRRLALLSCCLVLLIAAAGWRSAPSGAAGALVPRSYVPLIVNENDISLDLTATAEALGTPTPTVTATTEPAQPVDISGTVYVRPRFYVLSTPQPIEYAVVLDTSSSMNLNFDGEALDTDGVTRLQCTASSDPVRYMKFEQDITRCQQIAATWLPRSERRIGIAKAALSNLIDRMEPFDTMQIVGFSAATTEWIYGTPEGKQQLTASLLSMGATNGDPYTTSDGSSTATSLKMVRERMISAPTTSVNGRAFRPVVLVLAGSVPNYFLNSSNPDAGFGWYNDAHDNASCAELLDRDYIPSCQTGLTNTSPSIARPITAMAREAAEIKILNDGNTVIYAIALNSLAALGLATDIASQPTFPYYSEAPSEAPIQVIEDAIRNVQCVPSGGTAWLGTIDSSHTITDTAERVRFGLPADQSVYGYAYLSDANGLALQSAPVRPDQSGQLGYSFTNVAPGTYHLASFVAYKGDDQPTRITRIYNWILFPNLDHDTSLTFSLTPSSSLGGTIPLDPLYLDMQGSVCPAV